MEVQWKVLRLDKICAIREVCVYRIVCLERTDCTCTLLTGEHFGEELDACQLGVTLSCHHSTHLLLIRII